MLFNFLRLLLNFLRLLLNLLRLLFNLLRLLFNLLVLLFYRLIFQHNGCIPSFNLRQNLILHLHIPSNLRRSRRHYQTVHQQTPFLIHALVIYLQVVVINGHPAILVKDAQQPFQVVTRTPLQVRYLHDDAVVCQALYERVRHALGDFPTLIVQVPASHIHDRLVQIPQLMS